MMKQTLIFLKSTLLVILLIACKKDNDPPTCSINYPHNNDTFSKGTTIVITGSADDSDGGIDEIKLYIDEVLVDSLSDKSFSHFLDTKYFSIGSHIIMAIAKDNKGNEANALCTFNIVSGVADLSIDSVISIFDTKALIKGHILNNGGTEILQKGFYYGESENLILNGSKIIVEEGNDEFSTYLIDLSPVTKYYVQSYAINEKGISFSKVINFTTKNIEGSTVQDYEGNIYKTVKIGEQWWMAENLKSTKYNNGDIIGTTSPPTLDISLKSSPKYQWAYNGDESNARIYGRLYTYYTIIDNRKVCPSGWHVPSDSEWTVLTTYLGGENVTGGKIKEIETTHWNSPNVGATNETGFTALPSGIRYSDGSFHRINEECYLWSSTSYNADDAWRMNLSYGMRDIGRATDYKEGGFSVRCIKD